MNFSFEEGIILDIFLRYFEDMNQRYFATKCHRELLSGMISQLGEKQQPWRFKKCDHVTIIG